MDAVLRRFPNPGRDESPVLVLPGRGWGAGRLSRSFLRDRCLSSSLFAGCSFGFSTGRTFAPKNPCPPYRLLVAAAGRFCCLCGCFYV